jgi:DNA repair photolyase
MEYSMNPYQGCEHGCSYCFARPTHEYWGYSAGIDFERKIMVKKNAPELLESFFRKRISKLPFYFQEIQIVISLQKGSLKLPEKYCRFVWITDILSIFLQKCLVLRDMDILKPLAEQNLVSVSLVFPPSMRNFEKMEPRTSSAKNKLKAIEILSENKIPVNVMVAPIIPGLNSDEPLTILKLFLKQERKVSDTLGKIK